MILKKEVTELSEQVKAYLETRLEIVRLQAVASMAKAIADGLSYLITAVLFLFFLLFVSLGLVFLINKESGNELTGWFVIGGIYLFASIIYFKLLRKKQDLKVTDLLIRNMLKDEAGDK